MDNGRSNLNELMGMTSFSEQRPVRRSSKCIFSVKDKCTKKMGTCTGYRYCKKKKIKRY